MVGSRPGHSPRAGTVRDWKVDVDPLELDEIRALVDRGQQFGFLTYAAVSQAIGELELDGTEVEEVHGMLERADIELVEELDPAFAAAGEPEGAGRSMSETALDLKPEVTTDSLQLFLREIGRARLLTAEQEVALAKRIERGDLDAKRKMVECNLRLVVSIELPKPGIAVSGPDPGGHARADPRGREVRLPQGV